MGAFVGGGGGGGVDGGGGGQAAVAINSYHLRTPGPGHTSDTISVLHARIHEAYIPL